tara:strand:+ start:433 stop:1059 length:627 start_codon:yes stop_codon:yes gene_type:complete
MTKRHWITTKECKELYNVSYNQLQKLVEHGVVTTKKDDSKGKGRPKTLFNHAQVKIYGKLNRAERRKYMAKLNGTTLGRKSSKKTETDSAKTEEYKLEKDVYSKDYNKWRRSKNWSSYMKDDFTKPMKAKKNYVEVPKYGKHIASVNQPEHYNPGKIPVIDAIEDWNLNFSAGNVVKYLVRAGRKDKEEKEKDLQKALWYLIRMLKDE